MPVTLHQHARNRLKDLLTKVLPTLEIQNGRFMENFAPIKLWLVNEVLPKQGKLRDELVDYIDEYPLMVFITDTLAQELSDTRKYMQDSTTRLADDDQYKDIPALAERLLSAFESLPWTYRITVQLPETLSGLLPIDLDHIDLSPSVRIARTTEEFKITYPTTSKYDERNSVLKGSAGLLGLLVDAPQWPTDRVHLQLTVRGFIGPYGLSNPARAAERYLRSFLGIGLGVRLFDTAPQYDPPGPRTPVFVHRLRADSSWEPMTRYDLSEAVTRGMRSLKLHTLNDRLDTDDKKRAWIAVKLIDIGSILQLGPRADQALLGSQWLFDSYSGHDELLAFIQSMVVLEIILGDKAISDEIGIGKLISNRFAYLVGTTHRERSELIEDFSKIYRVRSQIVHSGKHRLTLEERVLFGKLKWMGRRAIDKEVELLKAGIDADGKKTPA